jgi:hypothetical protein
MNQGITPLISIGNVVFLSCPDIDPEAKVLFFPEKAIKTLII